MKSYNTQPNLTSSGLETLAHAIRTIMEGDSKRIDIGHGTVLATVPSNDPKQYTIIITMDVEEE